MVFKTYDIVGFAAATLTTASFLPQLIHTYRTRDVDGISVLMYSLFSLGVLLWLVYGFMLGSWPIIAANGVTLALSAAILWIKLRS